MKIDYVKNGNVISIATARTGLKYPAVAQAEGYWNGLRGNRLLPARADLDPRGISSILQHAFILEKIAPGIAKVRLSGQRLNDLLGMEMRGMPISSIFLPEARSQIQNALERLFDGPATVHATLISKGGFTRKTLDAQLFLAPMLDDQGRVTRALGALQVGGDIDRAPRRFSFQSLSVKELLTDAGHAPGPQHHKPETPSVPPRQTDEQREGQPVAGHANRDQTAQHSRTKIPGFAEHATGFDRRTNSADKDTTVEKPTDAPTITRGHLRLIKAD